MVECRLLGTTEIRVDGRPLDLGPAKQRALLVALLVTANTAVSADQLIDRVWGDHPPLRVRNSLQSHLSRLRTALSSAPLSITARSGRYLLAVDEQTIDLHRFRHLMGQARGEAGDERALGLAEQALALWRGEPFGDLDTPWLADVRAGLERELLAARLDHADVALRCGKHVDVLATLSTLAGEHPLDERLAGQLMLALYRAGRQADALAHYQQIRRHLADELGTDPGPALQRLHQRVLNADPALAATPEVRATSVVPRQLPVAPWAFIGREEHLAALTATLDSRSSVVISAVRGAGGIGKTWLALAWAYRHLDRFPDGQLFVDLRGFSADTEPLAPSVAVRGFLDALGVDAGRIPVDPQAQTGLFRSMVANRRMLIVLDNAADADQVATLLPGGDSCTVVVTSRRALTGLITRFGAQHLALDALNDDDARALLVRRLGAERVAAEPRAAEELVRSCGGLPLALGIIAGRAHAYPGVPLAEFAEDLRGLGLGALDDDDPAIALPTVLSWSYRALPAEQQVVFCLLGIAPGPDIGLPAAASLTGLPPERTAEVLSGLAEASLLAQDAHGRYSMHDLVRRYATDTAREQLPGDAREAALRRVIDHYAHTANAADRLLDPHRPAQQQLDPPAPGCRPQHLPDSPAALAWFDAERPCLLASQQIAAAHHMHPAVWQLAWSLTTFNFRRGHRREQLAVWQAGLAAAEHLDDASALTLAHRQLGYAHALLRQHDEAIKHLRESLTLAELHHDHANQAHAHRALTWAWGQRGDDRLALEHGTHALEIYRTLGNPVWEAHVLNAMGWHAARLGRHDEARDHCQAALDLFRRHADPFGQAAALDSLGYLAHHTGQHEQAVSHYDEALALRRDLGATYEIAEALDGLGHPHAALGRYAQARAVWREALELFRDQGRVEDADRVQRQLDALD